MKLVARVREASARHDLLRSGQRILVAFSGGPDSSALLHVLLALRAEFSIEVLAAHLDHAQRAGSRKDHDYCQRVGRRLGIAVVTGHLPPGRRSEQRLRLLRYEFLAEQAAMVGAAAVATGHTRDDQSETLVYHMLRGSGSQGLGAIPPVTMHGSVRVIRPLIMASRTEVLRFLDHGGHRYLTDPTNALLDRDRNRIRHEAMPLLESIRPGAAGCMARTADVLRDDADYLAAAGRRYLKRHHRPGEPLAGLERQHPALARQIVRELIRRERGDLYAIGLAMVDDTLRLLRASVADGRRRHLPLAGPWVVAVERRGVRIVPGHRGKPLPLEKDPGL